jgi:hypothetical protein
MAQSKPGGDFVAAIKCKPCKEGKHDQCVGTGRAVCFCPDPVCTAARRSI